jgi:hypothetical protein
VFITKNSQQSQYVPCYSYSNFPTFSISLTDVFRRDSTRSSGKYLETKMLCSRTKSLLDLWSEVSLNLNTLFWAGEVYT